jgi:2-dehydropantoate 2-reductase
MRFLIVGAGALGGYFGARLLAAGQDVTFLLRPRRAAQLQETGLVVRSPFGDLQLAPPPYLLAEQIDTPFDAVIVGCKAYDLEQTMESFAAAVGPDTAILPLLNGMRHLEQLSDRFGADKVLGGLSMISATLGERGEILHLNDTHILSFGERDGSLSTRVSAIAADFAKAHFDSRPSREIMQDMWEKWAFVAPGAGVTSLMRGTIGDIVGASGLDFIHAMIDECHAIAAYNGHAPRPPAIERTLAMLTAPGSSISASMAKDIDRGARVEADHILGDLIRRADPAMPATSLLKVAYVHLKAYEARSEREAAAA